jgi:hypothetical protein
MYTGFGAQEKIGIVTAGGGRKNGKIRRMHQMQKAPKNVIGVETPISPTAMDAAAPDGALPRRISD